MSSYNCPRCKADIVIPDDLQGTLKNNVALTANQNRISATKELREKAKLPLADAKAIAFHIASKEGRCHRCNSTLPDQEIAHCAKCHSLNLNW